MSNINQVTPRSVRDELADIIEPWAGEEGVYHYADRILQLLADGGYEVNPEGALSHAREAWEEMRAEKDRAHELLAVNREARLALVGENYRLAEVVKAARKQLDAYEHDKTCEEEGEGDCCLEAHHQAYKAMTAAFDSLKVNPRSEA
jgi:hypothetical protein